MADGGSGPMARRWRQPYGGHVSTIILFFPPHLPYDKNRFNPVQVRVEPGSAQRAKTEAALAHMKNYLAAYIKVF
jgi:hypothetical protein